MPGHHSCDGTLKGLAVISYTQKKTVYVVILRGCTLGGQLHLIEHSSLEHRHRVAIFDLGCRHPGPVLVAQERKGQVLQSRIQRVALLRGLRALRLTQNFDQPSFFRRKRCKTIRELANHDSLASASCMFSSIFNRTWSSDNRSTSSNSRASSSLSSCASSVSAPDVLTWPASSLMV